MITSFSLIFKKIKINAIFVFVLVFLSVFDQMRESLPLPNVINLLCASIRDGIISYLFVSCIARIKVTNKYIITIFCLGAIAVFLGIINTQQVLQTIKVFWCYLKSILLFYIFINIEYLTNILLVKWLRIFIILTTIFAISNIIVSLLFSSLLLRIFSGGLRLTVGNPSIISYMYISVLVCILYSSFFKRQYIQNLVKGLFFLSILSTVTTTAFIALMPIFILYFFSLRKVSKRISFLFVILFFFIIIFSMLNYIPRLKMFSKYFFEKSDEFFSVFQFSNELSNVGTMPVRANAISMVNKSFVFYDYLFGLGFNGYTRYVSLVENQYAVVFFNFGLLGIAYCLTILGKKILTCLLQLNYFALTIYIVFLCYCMTLEFFLPYITGFCFSLQAAFLKIYGTKYMHTNLYLC